MMPIQNWIHSHVVRPDWISWRKCTKCIRKGVMSSCAQQYRLDWGLSFFQCFSSIFYLPIHSNEIQIVPLSSFQINFPLVEMVSRSERGELSAVDVVRQVYSVQLVEWVTELYSLCRHWSWYTAHPWSKAVGFAVLRPKLLWHRHLCWIHSMDLASSRLFQHFPTVYNPLLYSAAKIKENKILMPISYTYIKIAFCQRTWCPF